MHTFNPPTEGWQFLVPCVDLPPGSSIYCNLKKKKDNWKKKILLKNREVKNSALAFLYLFWSKFYPDRIICIIGRLSVMPVSTFKGTVA
jgi:hypothetical protein